MKITVAQWDLSNALQKLQAVIPARTPTEILQNVLLEATSQGLYCTAANGEIATKILVEGLLEEPGKITVNCRKLAALVRSLDEDQVDLKATANDRLQILSGKGRYTFGGLDADEFYAMPSSDKVAFKMESGALRAALIDTDFVASTEEVRYMLNGVCLTFGDDNIEFAGCDGRQFAVSIYETDLDGELEQIVIPLRSCQEIKRVFTNDEELSVSVEKSYLVFSTNTYQFSTRKVDLTSSPYPDYWKFVKFDDKDVVLANKEQLQKAIQRISIFAKDDNHGIDITVNEEEDSLDVKAESSEHDGHESVDISSRTANLDFRVNSKYLSGILSHLSCEDVMIVLSPDKTRITLKCPDNENQIYTVALLRRGEG